jgi:type VI protein secretion system component Hcp
MRGKVAAAFRTLSSYPLALAEVLAMILVHIDGVNGDATLTGYAKGDANHKETGWFVAESFGFGVEREMKESGEKGGTEDLNIGVGELQECTISKSMDRASAKLAQFAINGNSLGTAIIDFVQTAGGSPTGKPMCYLRYMLERCFIKSWSTSGSGDERPTEDVAFYYNKIAFQYMATKDGKTFENGGEMTWDNVRGEPWDMKVGLK